MRTASTAARIRSTADHEQPAVHPVGQHAGVEAEQQPGRRWSRPASATRNGSEVCEATSSGPAASPIPSPRLLVQDEPTSQRNDVPIRCRQHGVDHSAHDDTYVRRRSSTGSAFARGLLTLEEGDERVAAAYAARFLDDLPPLTADLPPAPAAAPVAPGWRALAAARLAPAADALVAGLSWRGSARSVRARPRLALAAVALLALLSIAAVTTGRLAEPAERWTTAARARRTATSCGDRAHGRGDSHDSAHDDHGSRSTRASHGRRTVPALAAGCPAPARRPAPAGSRSASGYGVRADVADDEQHLAVRARG